jgi:uncharacterized membrane protein
MVLASEALSVTIFYILLWFVIFPAFVMGMIVYAIVVARGEKLENDENRRYPRD